MFSHTRNFDASAGCLLPVKTTLDEPPHAADLVSPAVHCGIGATAHLPEVEGAPLEMVFAPQTAETQVQSWPLSYALFHWSVKLGSVLTSFLSMRSCQ